MIVCNNELDETQLKMVHDLALLCRETDGGTPTFYNHLLLQKRPTDNNVFYFNDGELIGFLSVYFFYDDACEVSLIVHPQHRRKKIAKQLLHTIIPLLIAKEMVYLIFSSPEAINERWLSKLGFSYRHGEYHMQRNSYEPILQHTQKMHIRKAVDTDIPNLCAIDEACFPQAQKDMFARFTHLLNDNCYSLFIASYNERVVGKAHIHWQSQEAIFSDIAILPQYQRQGLGGEMLVYCINHALSSGKKKLSLDVETSNRNALNLYLRHGFQIANVSDYWLIPLQKLTQDWEI